MKREKKKLIILSILVFTMMLGTHGAFNSVYAEEESKFEVMPVTSGFNVDVVATSADGDDSEGYKNTTALDYSGNAAMKACLYTKDVSETAGFLPNDGIIHSQSIEDLTWKLGDYKANNALKLSKTDSAGTLGFGEVKTYENVYFLCIAGGLGANNSATMNAIINYTDGSNSESTFKIWDWYSPSSVATESYRRLNAGYVDGETNGGPYMTQCSMDVDGTKKIQSITIGTDNIKEGMYLSILAITGHNHVKELANNEQGHWYKCVNCSEETKLETHNYGNWDTVKEATDKGEGLKQRVCTTCGYIEKVTIPVVKKVDEKKKEVPTTDDKKKKVPPTTDMSQIALYSSLLFLSGCIIVTKLNKKKKENI